MPSSKRLASKRTPASSRVAPCRAKGAKLRETAVRNARAVLDALATYSLDSDNLHVAIEALRVLLGADRAFLYSFAPRPDGDDLVLTRSHSVAPPADVESDLNDFLRGRGSENALHALGQVAMRVLVCEGPTMLAWVGIIQDRPTTEVQRAFLERLVPAFRRRLLFERRLEDAPLGTDVPQVVHRLALTAAQARVFEPLARGASNAMIATQLGIAERTVEAHVTAILMKAQVPNRASLIVRIFGGAPALAAVPNAV